MNSNTLWAIFWISLFSCIAIESYFDHLSVINETESDLAIAKLQLESDLAIYEKYNVLINEMKELGSSK